MNNYPVKNYMWLGISSAYLVLAMLTGCSTVTTSPPEKVVTITPDEYARRIQLEQTQKANALVERTISQAPEWMNHLPTSENAVYENGTAVSSDWAMADHKAKSIAFGKICMAAGGTANQSTKIYNRETESGNQSFTELAMQTKCKEIDLTGVEVKELKHISEGNRYRTYVLIALPVGEANIFKGQKSLAKKEVKAQPPRELTTEERANNAFKELDNSDSKEETIPSSKQSQSKVVGVVVPDTGQTSELKLMDVDNAEYKARREVALQKPGAVIGQTTIQN